MMTALPRKLGAAADPIASQVLERLIQREGGHRRVTKDSGGVTRGGIAETSGMPADQIRKLTPDQINKIWLDKWRATEGIQNPGLREILLDMRGNIGEPKANQLLQESMNSLLPAKQRLAVDRVAGSRTMATASQLQPTELADQMMRRYQAHHEQLVKANPKKYGPYATGWGNRRQALIGSPLVRQMYQPPAAPTAPVAPPPVTALPANDEGIVVKGTPPPGAVIVSNPPPSPKAPPLSASFDQKYLQPGKQLPLAGGLTKQQSIFELLKCSSFASDLRRARNATHTHPTPAQAQAGNYRHGTVTVRGFTIKLENPQGSTRCGKDADGRAWSRVMANDYGYFKGIQAVDGDRLDVFIGPDPENGRIFVVDQHIDGRYDESKVLLGYSDEQSARKSYLAHYPPNWKGLKHIREMSDEKFKEWTRGGQDTPAKAASTLDLLLEAKAHSDAGRMTAKQAILRQILEADPQAFDVDQPKAKHPGLTHRQTGFRIHAPRTVAALAAKS